MLQLNHSVINVGVQNLPWIFVNNTANTDLNGRFVFEHWLSPGRYGSARNLNLNELGTKTRPEKASTARIQTRLTAGQTTRINFGATGRPVIGQLEHASDSKQETPWSFAYIDVVPLVQVVQAPTFMATVDREGNFCIDDVPPGDYVLQIDFFKNRTEHLAGHRFTVPEINEKLSQRPVDLGVLTLKPGRQRP